MRTTSLSVMVIFSESGILKVTYHSYAQSSFSTITSHTENSTLKDTLRRNNLRTWTNIRAKPFFIKTLINIMKKKSMKVPQKRSVAQKFKRALEEHYT